MFAARAKSVRHFALLAKLYARGLRLGTRCLRKCSGRCVV